MLDESSNLATPPSGKRLCITPWLCGYWPVRKVALDGQHSGKVAKELENVIALSIILPFMLGASPAFTSLLSDRLSRSSAMITTMFGREIETSIAAAESPTDCSGRTI